MSVSRRFLFWLALVCGAAAISMHVPGQMSYDSSVQLYEAATAQSVSWNPPFMSAVLRWLGGGLMATTIFVVINSFLTYGCLSLVTALPSRRRLGVAQTVASAAIIINPVLFCYVGIVWKDVFFATWLAATLAICVVASRLQRSRPAVVIACLALLLVGLGPLIRQQGVLIAPIVAIAPLLIIWRRIHVSRRFAAVAAAAILCGCTTAVVGSLSTLSIRGNEGRDMSVGPNVIALFDIAGIIVRLPEDVATREMRGLTSSDYDAVRNKYSPTRADSLNSIPKLPIDLINGADGASLLTIWWRSVEAHPIEYLQHRTRVMLALLDVGDLQRCVPTQVGIDGRADYFERVGITPGTSKRAQFLYQLASRFFGTPIWRNWCYVALLVCVVLAISIRRDIPDRSILIVFCIALAVFVIFFAPTAIACDFRYLYPLIPALSVLTLLVLAT